MVPGRRGQRAQCAVNPLSTTLGPSRVHAPSSWLGIGDPIPLPTMAHSYPHCNISTMITRWGERNYTGAVKTVIHELIRTPKSSGVRGDCCRTISGFEPIKKTPEAAKDTRKIGEREGISLGVPYGEQKEKALQNKQVSSHCLSSTAPYRRLMTSSRSNRHAFFSHRRRMHVSSLRYDHVHPTSCSRSLM